MGNPGQTMQPYPGIVSVRVAFVLRSTEIHPLEIRFVSSFASTDRLLRKWVLPGAHSWERKDWSAPCAMGSPKDGGWLPLVHWAAAAIMPITLVGAAMLDACHAADSPCPTGAVAAASAMTGSDWMTCAGTSPETGTPVSPDHSFSAVRPAVPPLSKRARASSVQRRSGTRRGASRPRARPHSYG